MKRTSKRKCTPHRIVRKSTLRKGASYLWSIRSPVPFAQLPLGTMFDHFSLCLFGSEFYDVRPRFCHCQKEKVLKRFQTRPGERTNLTPLSANATLTN